MSDRKTNVERRLLSKVQRQEDGCWVWTAGTHPKGYGWFWMNGGNKFAHRASYELFVGPIPQGLTIDHLCRNRRCVNPAHLEPVTIGENVLRGVGLSAENARKTHCVHGHEFTPENTYLRRCGRRACRECLRRRYREFRARHRRAA